MATPDLACTAAHTALYLRPDGVVHACCATRWAAGSVTGPDRQSLHEIWSGAGLLAQRERLEAGRFDLGCEECELAIESGGRSASLAAMFDQWADDVPAQYPRLLDFALSNRCNLQCVMCSSEYSSSIRIHREGLPPMPSSYDDRFFEELAEFLPHLDRAQFKGGEPFLARENHRVWDMMIEQGSTCEVSVTTNGTVWTKSVERYVRELRMQVNVSVDAVEPSVLESIRLGVDAVQLWTNIDRFVAVAAEIGTELTLTFCLMRSNWEELPRFLEAVADRGVSCQVIMVTVPAAMDLLGLPTEELEHVLDVFERSEPRFVKPRPRSEWETVLARVRSTIERGHGATTGREVGVELSPRPGVQ